MEQNVRISSTSKLRSNKRKIKKEESLNITKAFYLGNYVILLFFNNGNQKTINFLPIFSKYVKGEFIKYAEPKAFKKFIIANGNIFWGRNEDVVFPVSFLYNHTSAKKIKEEILYVL
ncbi:MAG: DUF2442 domain-containing protein [Bacteroidetes bacterium]|nr:DUF2442 domain-containing protein [Bacteroidota bacterium]